MSRAEQREIRAAHLLGLLCDERLSDQDAVELAELLAVSDAARRRYVETVQLCVDLADWSQPASLIPISRRHEEVATNGHTRKQAFAPSRGQNKTGRMRGFFGKGHLLAPQRSWLHPWLLWSAAAATLLLVTMWGWSHINNGPASQSTGVAASGDLENSDPDKCAPSASFVARIVEVTADAKWDEELNPREFLMRLRAGDKLHLLAGMAHLEFYSGARIILQGPTEFTPTGAAKGTLESGRLTGKVDNGKFQLTTPSAKVVDLGTEFGVSVGPTSDTDVCVFDGEVQVRPGLDGSDDHKTSAEAFHLTQGMSVRVAATGKVSDGMDAGVDYDIYTRSFPSPAASNPRELDLVDIVCGGNGRGMRLAAAIDPLTGLWDRRPWNNSLGPGTRHGDRLFHSADWHPFIDGTFVPNQFGDALQVDTLGGTIVLPKNCGHYTWGPIWARRAVKDSTVWDRTTDSWGAKTYPVITERLMRSRLGGIGIHASVGITFDLKAIGKEHLGGINRFTGTLVNLENSKEHNPEWANSNPPPSADLRIFVDGQSRYERLNFDRNVDGVPIDVELSSDDRFLTFITTDAGNTNRYDHIVIIDPVLEVQRVDEVVPPRVRLPMKVEQAD
jgi:hypothetical protein